MCILLQAIVGLFSYFVSHCSHLFLVFSFSGMSIFVDSVMVHFLSSLNQRRIHRSSSLFYMGNERRTGVGCEIGATFEPGFRCVEILVNALIVKRHN